MSFDDILDDVFDFDEDKPQPEGVNKEEIDSGLWDTGDKENIWRSSDPQANGVWDSGCSGGCDSCGDECEEDEELYDDDPAEQIDPPEDIEPKLEESPEPEVAQDDSNSEPEDSGLFDDIFG